MEQHPIPRQITTFEFKLIGFLTLKQFLYLLVSVPTGFIVYKLFPIPLLNIVLGALVGGAGAAFAFVPINDRPLDVWIKNFIKRITSPTQYIFQKENRPLIFLQNLYFVADPHRIMAHIESQEKLASYMAASAKPAPQTAQKQNIFALFSAKPGLSPKVVVAPPAATGQPSLTLAAKQPLFTGVVKNHKLFPLPGILIYVKDEKSEVKRLLKTNPHGVFATFSLLPSGEYFFETKDPKNTYFFDTIKIPIQETNPKPIEIFSKELM